MEACNFELGFWQNNVFWGSDNGATKNNKRKHFLNQQRASF